MEEVVNSASLGTGVTQAAVVVDDSFTPLGLVYLEDIEAELIRRQLLAEPDANFGRPPPGGP
jgi:hypothetical protein